MYIDVKLQSCGDSSCVNVNFHLWFVLYWLYKPYWCCWCPETEIVCIY
jgi:hypothetical protein